mmetsp:Transcript_53977/g.100739  ORF Transcript_53977/g.100739 Transcript_53977/m.100739 type:complete len:217 (+) Transcript_53977:309-959(+)
MSHADANAEFWKWQDVHSRWTVLPFEAGLAVPHTSHLGAFSLLSANRHVTHIQHPASLKCSWKRDGIFPFCCRGVVAPQIATAASRVGENAPTTPPLNLLGDDDVSGVGRCSGASPASPRSPPRRSLLECGCQLLETEAWRDDDGGPPRCGEYDEWRGGFAAPRRAPPPPPPPCGAVKLKKSPPPPPPLPPPPTVRAPSVAVVAVVVMSAASRKAR